jgi:hypothetical protein
MQALSISQPWALRNTLGLSGNGVIAAGRGIPRNLIDNWVIAADRGIPIIVTGREQTQQYNRNK